MQRAKRSHNAPPCSCGMQPFHVVHLAGNRHSYECPPCGITTPKFGSDALALMNWRHILTQEVWSPAVIQPPVRAVA